MSPKVSILMPVYNGEKYLNESMESVLGQTFKDFEFIIIDDKSTDGSLNIIKSYQDSRIIVLTNETNLGSAGSMNKGLNKAVGEYVARMDADDISLSNRIEEQVQFMTCNPDIGVCGTWVSVIGDDHEYVWRYNTDSDEIKSRLLFDCPLAHPSIMFRNSILKNNSIHYSLAFRRAEDYEFYVRMVELCQFANLPKVLLKYRLHSAQTSNIFAIDYNKWIEKIHRYELMKIGIYPNISELELHRKISNIYLPVTENFVIATNNWLSKIKKANISSHYVSDKSLSKIISIYWYSMLLHCLKGDRKLAIRAFFNLLISKNLSLEQKIKFLIKFFYVR